VLCYVFFQIHPESEHGEQQQLESGQPSRTESLSALHSHTQGEESAVFFISQQPFQAALAPLQEMRYEVIELRNVSFDLSVIDEIRDCERLFIVCQLHVEIKHCKFVSVFGGLYFMLFSHINLKYEVILRVEIK
jgi:hypothetical protein